MDRYEVMAGKMKPLTDGAHRKWGFTGKVNDEEDGIGSVIYWTVEVERRVEYKENEWLPCDESGRIDDGYGNEPNATVAYLSSLEGSREERAFELAKNEYLAWLEHKADRYTTVYGYMD